MDTLIHSAEIKKKNGAMELSTVFSIGIEVKPWPPSMKKEGQNFLEALTLLAWWVLYFLIQTVTVH